jgi:hypothetical protein
MTLYAIFTKPDKGPEALAALPERFVWSAFVLTPFWALSKRAWAFLVLWIVVTAALVASHQFIGTDAAMTLYLVFAIWSGFAAPAIAARVLERSGWLAHGELAAPDLETAERLWLERIYGARR